MASLKFNVAAIHLAQALYYSRAEAFNMVLTLDWDQLLPAEKHEFVDVAQRALESVRPYASAKVVARITPSAPWGETA